MMEKTSIQSVMKNIHSYLEVLEAARGEKAGHWDCQSLHHAYKWAAYCVQIYQRAEGKPYRDELDKNVRKFNELSWKLGEIAITLELLKSAEKMLTKALLQNAHLSSSVYEELIQVNVSAGPEKAENFVQICAELSTTKNAMEIGRKLRMDQKAQRTLRQSDCLLQHIQQTLNNCQSEKQEKYKNYLENKLSDAVKNNLELESLLIALCGEDSDISQFPDAKDFIMSYLSGAMETDVQLQRRVFMETDKQLVYTLCRFSLQFSLAYLRSLITRAARLTPDYSCIPIKWRSEASDVTCEELVQDVKFLLQANSQSTQILDTISRESNKSDFNVWKTVLREIERTQDK